MIQILLRSLCLLGFLAMPAFAEDLTADQSKKLEDVIKQAGEWARDPDLVNAVKEYNAKGRDTTRDMNQDKWAKLTIMDPIVKDLRSNATAKFLGTKKSDLVSEAFVSGADGTKLGFISKTSNWSHKGKPKHDDPMAGKTWIGKPEKDASTGLSQVQFGLPILDGGKAIGSLVVGVAVSKL